MKHSPLNTPTPTNEASISIKAQEIQLSFSNIGLGNISRESLEQALKISHNHVTQISKKLIEGYFKTISEEAEKRQKSFYKKMFIPLFSARSLYAASPKKSRFDPDRLVDFGKSDMDSLSKIDQLFEKLRDRSKAKLIGASPLAKEKLDGELPLAFEAIAMNFKAIK